MVSKIAIFTIGEARAQWCPHARIGSTGGNSNNRWINGGDDSALTASKIPSSCCIAADCMAWRWYETNIQSEPGGLYESNGETYGYCGLSGSPSPMGGR